MKKGQAYASMGSSRLGEGMMDQMNRSPLVTSILASARARVLGQKRVRAKESAGVESSRPRIWGVFFSKRMKQGVGS